jgi:EamA domain-containing membrane protein RarD
MQLKRSINIKHARQVTVADQKNDRPGILFMMLTLIAAIVASDIAKQHMQSNIAIGVACCLIGLIVAAKVRWDLRGRWWFWVALCVGALMQLPLVLFMPWSNRYLTGTSATAFVIPGFLMALGCVFFAEKIFANSTSPK